MCLISSFLVHSLYIMTFYSGQSNFNGTNFALPFDIWSKGYEVSFPISLLLHTSSNVLHMCAFDYLIYFSSSQASKSN